MKTVITKHHKVRLKEKKMNWINIKETEKRPANHQAVLVWAGIYGVPITAIYENGEWYDFLSEELLQGLSITHWSKMPERPNK